MLWNLYYLLMIQIYFYKIVIFTSVELEKNLLGLRLTSCL